MNEYISILQGYIDHLEYMKKNAYELFDREQADKDIEAFKAAIKALEQDPGEELISCEAVIEWLKAKDIIKLSSQEKVARKELKALPSGNPQAKTGHWIYIRNSEVNGLKIVECSECGKRTYGSGNYCPNCGAKMKSEG